jgi:hypothetical protein
VFSGGDHHVASGNGHVFSGGDHHVASGNGHVLSSGGIIVTFDGLSTTDATAPWLPSVSSTSRFTSFTWPCLGFRV